MNKEKVISLGAEKVKKTFNDPSRVEKIMHILENHAYYKKEVRKELKQDLIKAGFKAINDSRFGDRLYCAVPPLDEDEETFYVWANDKAEAERISNDYLKQIDYAFFEVVDTLGNIEFF